MGINCGWRVVRAFALLTYECRVLISATRTLRCFVGGQTLRVVQMMLMISVNPPH